MTSILSAWIPHLLPWRKWVWHVGSRGKREEAASLQRQTSRAAPRWAWSPPGCWDPPFPSLDVGKTVLRHELPPNWCAASKDRGFSQNSRKENLHHGGLFLKHFPKSRGKNKNPIFLDCFMILGRGFLKEKKSLRSFWITQNADSRAKHVYGSWFLNVNLTHKWTKWKWVLIFTLQKKKKSAVDT